MSLPRTHRAASASRLDSITAWPHPTWTYPDDLDRRQPAHHARHELGVRGLALSRPAVQLEHQLRSTNRLEDCRSRMKLRKVATGTTVASQVPDAMRMCLARCEEAPRPQSELPVFHGTGVLSGIDLNCSASMLGVMHGPDDSRCRQCARGRVPGRPCGPQSLSPIPLNLWPCDRGVSSNRDASPNPCSALFH